MTTPVVKLPAVGQALLGDWRARINERLLAAGFDSVHAFVAARPLAPVSLLVDELSTDLQEGINRSDVAHIQLVELWREECHEDAQAVERFAKRLLIGILHDHLPEGWHADWTRDENARAAFSRLNTKGLSGWPSDVGSDYRDAANRVLSALIKGGREGTVPNGWLPADEDDPVLTEIFHRCWSSATR